VGVTGDAELLLAAADALANDLVSAARPIRFRVAATNEEREAIYGLRYRTVMASGWADAGSMPSDGLERDGWDDTALHIGAWDGDDLIACARLIFPHQTRPLPTEEAFGILVPNAGGGTVDVGRGIVEPSHRDEDRTVFIGLLATCWLELHGRGFSRMCGDAASWLIAIYQRMGFQVEILGPSRRFWGEERVPILIDGLASARSVIERLSRS
jgi:predicted GNAT family N-acyltransferase